MGDQDARDLLMEFGYSGQDATRKVAEMKPDGQVELADPGETQPQVILTCKNGQWNTHERTGNG